MPWTFTTFPSSSFSPSPPLYNNPQGKPKHQKTRKQRGNPWSILPFSNLGEKSVSRLHSVLDRENNYDFGGSAKHGRTHTNPLQTKGPPSSSTPLWRCLLAIFSISQFQRGLTDEGPASSEQTTVTRLFPFVPVSTRRAVSTECTTPTSFLPLNSMCSHNHALPKPPTFIYFRAPTSIH